MKKLVLSTFFCIMIVFSIFSLNACMDVIQRHNIEVTYYNGQYGTTSGFGYYTTNSTVVIRAIPKGGHSFLAWIKNDIIVSRDAEYSFIANAQTEGKYIALFSTDTLEFFRISEISYEITGLDLTASDKQLKNVAVSEIKNGTTSGIYNNFASSPIEEMSNTGNFSTTNFQFFEKVFFLNKIYYFTAKINYDYLKIQNAELTSGEIQANFAINFSLLNSGTISGNVKTYVAPTYTLTQTFENNQYTIEVDYTGLQKPTSWNEESTHKLHFKLVYPFDVEEEGEL